MRRNRLFTVVLGMAGMGVLLLPEFVFGAAGNTGVNLGNPSNITLTISTTAIDLGTVTPGAAQTFANAVTTTVVSSKGLWNLTVQASGDFSDGAGAVIPINRMSVKESTGATYSPLSTSALTLLAGMAKNNPVGQSYDWDFQVLVETSDPTSSNPFATQLTFTAF